MDIWRVGLVEKSFRDVAASGFGDAPVRWIEADRPFSFLADPFGLWRDEHLFLFVEAYDYRTRLGHIELLQFDRGLNLLGRRPCLKEAWHLSYPFVFEAENEIWMLPEAHRSGKLTLYRCSEFPDVWQAECVVDLPELAVDATPLFHQGLWWLFYSPAGRSGPLLHAAHAKSLTGRWSLYPMNPLVEGSIASRPGGTPIVDNDRILVPVQECANGYGSGIRLLEVNDLTTGSIKIGPVRALPPPTSTEPFNNGFHTLSAAGEVTLIDVKRIEGSLRRLPIDALGRAHRSTRRWFPRSR